MDYIKKALPGKLNKIGGIFLGLGVLILILTYMVEPTRAFFDYLWIYMFLVSLAVGSLALVALEYLVGATWSTPFRRIIEFFAALTPFLIILVIPLFLGLHNIFQWTNTDIVQGDSMLRSKSPYLNVQFFTIRTAAILILWLFFYTMITRNSVKQDTSGDPKLTKKNIRFSVLFAPLFVLTITVMGIDWMMSLEPRWYSTMFGVYYFAGTLVSAFSVATFGSVLLKRGGYLDERIKKDSFYSLGTLIFGFNIFWAYIAFSQFLLIWYADLPEETFWMLHRWEGNWKFVSIALLFIHFIIPFLILASRRAKTNLKLLRVMSLWMLCAHALDLYWLIMPAYFKGNASFGWSELSFPLFTAGLTILVFKFKADKKNLIPVRDPKLQAGFDFHL
jgi:hypothetical protein